MIEILSRERSKFRFGFRGAKTSAYNLVLAAMKKSPHRFIDLCAGSNLVGYEVRRRFQIPVVTNDPDYNSVCISRAFLQPNSIQQDDRVITPYYGSGSSDPKISSYFHTDVVNWFDGFAKVYADNPLYLAALGTVLRTKATFRGVMFERKTAGMSLTIPILEKAISRFIKHKALYIVPGPPAQSCWGTARMFLEKIEPGGVCYIDCPWPNKNGSDATYVLFAKQINKILLQRETPFEFYSLVRNNVLDEVLFWVRKSVSKFEQVLLATQSTNYPEVTELEKILRREFVVEEIYYQPVQGRTYNREITEYLFSINGDYNGKCRSS